MTLRAPFPYFGGKSRAATEIWRAFGPRINNYVEPFCGSAALLLARPGGPGKIETINDAACVVANFWRAMSAAPLEVASHCDRPVNECDMHAMHIWLLRRLKEIEEQLRTDIDFYDAKVAGLWVHGMCSWIGGGWCQEPKTSLHRKRPAMDGANAGRGVHSGGAYSPGRRPTMSSAGQGVHLPSLGNDRGLNGIAAAPCTDWFLDLQVRLRRVRVACGDWKRVLGPSVLGKGKNVGGRRPCAVFLDPPYLHEFRDPYLYCEDDGAISALVREWALEHGDDPDLRVALCGYVGEHEMPSSWTEHAWKGARGYAAEDNDNREKERIWFSPHCLPIDRQRGLFDEARA